MGLINLSYIWKKSLEFLLPKHWPWVFSKMHKNKPGVRPGFTEENLTAMLHKMNSIMSGLPSLAFGSILWGRRLDFLVLTHRAGRCSLVECVGSRGAGRRPRTRQRTAPPPGLPFSMSKKSKFHFLVNFVETSRNDDAKTRLKVRLHSWAHTHIDTSLHLLFAILLFFYILMPMDFWTGHNSIEFCCCATTKII